MQTSARNQFVGRIVSLKTGPISAEVTVDLGTGDSIIALITKDSADNLGLKEGLEVFTLVKASSVILVAGSDKVKLSARNQLRGKVIACKRGMINAEVTIQLVGNNTVTALITNESLDRLALKEGDTACAIFKAASVIIGVDL
jgi:molybdate transport system regulatory protein